MATEGAGDGYPLRLTGELDPTLSRGMWLVKWLLAIPHYFVLLFLGIAAAVVWIIALFAILFTGRYPIGLFDFTVGVMRWGWRVGFYAFAPAGTDRYPPFSLKHDPDYPARLEVDRPEQLSRGLVLVKWWLLAIPQYLILSALSGSGYGVGLSSAVILVGLLGLLFTGSYLRGLFDLAVGIERWSYRVGAYVLLLTDEYPPFRLDMGEHEPDAGAPALPPAPPLPTY